MRVEGTAVHAPMSCTAMGESGSSATRRSSVYESIDCDPHRTLNCRAPVQWIFAEVPEARGVAEPLKGFLEGVGVSRSKWAPRGRSYRYGCRNARARLLHAS